MDSNYYNVAPRWAQIVDTWARLLDNFCYRFAPWLMTIVLLPIVIPTIIMYHIGTNVAKKRYYKK